MLLTRKRYQKRKVIGGNLLGNAYDRAKGVLSTASKIITLPYRATKAILKPIVRQALPYVCSKTGQRCHGKTDIKASSPRDEGYLNEPKSEKCSNR